MLWYFLLPFERTWEPLLKLLFNWVSYLCRKGWEIDFKGIQIFSLGKYICLFFFNSEQSLQKAGVLGYQFSTIVSVSYVITEM